MEDSVKGKKLEFFFLFVEYEKSMKTLPPTFLCSISVRKITDLNIQKNTLIDQHYYQILISLKWVRRQQKWFCKSNATTTNVSRKLCGFCWWRQVVIMSLCKIRTTDRLQVCNCAADMFFLLDSHFRNVAVVDSSSGHHALFWQI